MTINRDKLTTEFMGIRPAGGFRVILVDPPWLFKNRSAAGEGKNPNQHYQCESIDDIASVPVDVLAAKDCALFIWVTWPLMEEWTDVIKGWGFRYAGLAWEWIKFNPGTGKYAFGPGYGTRKNLEPCLLATRGNPPLRTSIDALFNIDANGSRSVRDFITLFDGPYIELFARQTRTGWAAWGTKSKNLGRRHNA